MESIQEFLKPELIWFLIGLALLLAEFALPGLIVFFFGIGAWVVAIICLFVDISLNTQLVIFIVSSIVLLLALRRWLKGIFIGHVKTKQDLTEDMAEFIGEKAVVKKAIRPNVAGKVEFHGTDWTAEASEEIAEGATVEIIGKDNLTLKVKSL